MTGAADVAVPVRLPAGPLQWLYPELAALDRATVGSVAFEAAAARPPQRLVVPRGPRGAVVRRVLAQRLRDRGVEVLLDADVECAEVALAAAEACRRRSYTLEADAAGVVSEVGEDLLHHALARARARNRGELRPWLVPLWPGPRLAEWLDLLLSFAAAEPRMFAEAELIPLFVTDTTHPEGPVESRVPDSYWGLLPGDRYPIEVRDRVHRLVAALWPRRVPLFAALENAALGGFDLYLEALLGRELAPRAPPANRHPLLLGFCGIDGSGKSSHLQALREWLAARGLRVAVQKLYRHGVFHDTVTDLARLCAADKNLHLWRLERLCKLMDTVKCLPAVERDLAANDVVLFDRSVFTHYAAGTGRSHQDPYSREMLAEIPIPHRTFWLDVPVADAVARIGERSERTIDENPYMLGRYRAMLESLAGPHGFVVLDARAPFEANQARIRAAVAELLP